MSERPPSGELRGKISDRLRANLAADDDAWSPSRDADRPTALRQPTDGRAVTGRDRRQ